MESPAPDNLAGLLPDEPLTPVQAQLLLVARALLAPAGILVRTTEALPLGLRLCLGYAAPHAPAALGWLVLHHNRQGQWTRTVAEGGDPALTQAAAQLLVATGMAPAMPLW